MIVYEIKLFEKEDPMDFAPTLSKKTPKPLF